MIKRLKLIIGSISLMIHICSLLILIAICWIIPIFWITWLLFGWSPSSYFLDMVFERRFDRYWYDKWIDEYYK